MQTWEDFRATVAGISNNMFLCADFRGSSLHLLDAPKKAPLRPYVAHPTSASWVHFAPSGDQLLSTSVLIEHGRQGYTHLTEWDLATGKVASANTLRDVGACEVACSLDTRLVLTSPWTLAAHTGYAVFERAKTGPFRTFTEGLDDAVGPGSFSGEREFTTVHADGSLPPLEHRLR